MIYSGFEISQFNRCVYFKKKSSVSNVYLLLYVDMLLASCDKAAIEDLKKQLKGKFEMKDLGHALRMLEMEISRDRKRKTLKLTQKGYVNKVLERFSMSQAKPVSTPLTQHFKMTIENSPKIKEEVKYMEEIPYASVVGSIMYAMVCSRSDLVYATSMISRFMSSLGKEHWNVVKWVLRYLKGSIDVGILYGGGAIGELGVVVRYVDFLCRKCGHKEILDRICFHIVLW